MARHVKEAFAVAQASPPQRVSNIDGGRIPMKSKTVKQQEAQERQAAYDDLTVEQKIAKADAAPGASKRELARLVKL